MKFFFNAAEKRNRRNEMSLKKNVLAPKNSHIRSIENGNINIFFFRIHSVAWYNIQIFIAY